MMKMFNGIITKFASHSSSFLSNFYLDYALAFIFNLGRIFMEAIYKLAWVVVSFVMTVMDAMEYVAYSFLGVNFGVNDFSNLSEKVNIDVLSKTFRAVAGLSIVLMLVFTIIAIVRQEWQNVNSGFSKQGKDKKPTVANPKMPFINRLLRNLVLIIIMPALLFMIFAGTTSILNSFNLALKQNQSSTIAGQVLASSTYEANKYRMYASQNQRLPIVIKAYDDSKANYDNIDEMAVIIESMEVQETLRDTANKLSNKNLGTFGSTLVSKNNQYYNTEDYNKLYEQFICTAEQYYVMADFVDYAQQSGTTYYIKAIGDSSVEWKYVSSAVYSQATNELTVKYVNGEVVNGGYQASAASVDDEEYTITYTPMENVTTPISDALESIMAMLGIGEYGDNKYNVLDRDENFTNLVTWSNEKAWLQFSGGFRESDKSTWTDTDEILMYEFNRWKYNNSFRDYEISDLINGIEWDVKLITYQEYFDAVDLYSDDRYLYCVCINKNYYVVEKNENHPDKFGNAYYEIVEHDDMNFLKTGYTTVEDMGQTVSLKLSGGFDINNINGWTTQDQVLVYEYFQDETYQNKLRQFNFDEFRSGVSLPKYRITNYSDNGSVSDSSVCVAINNTFYKLSGNSISASGSLLNKLDGDKIKLYYHYQLNRTNFNASLTGRYGLTTNMGALIKTAPAINFSDLDLSIDADKYYENYKLKLSSNFEQNDMSTWSFRDIFVLYLYSKGYGYDIKYLKNNGVKADVGKIYGDYCLKIDDLSGDSISYIKIADVESISTEGIYSLNLEATLADNVFSWSNKDIFVSIDTEYDQIVSKELETYHFAFSHDFREHDDSTYTVQDLILCYASEKGLIDSVSNLKLGGYNALVYGEGENLYYRFGRNAENAYFLNHAAIVARFGSLEQFLNKPIKTLYGYSEGNAVAGAASLIGSYFGDFEVAEYQTGAGKTEELNFAANFEASNYKSWSQSDFILYYLCHLRYGNVNMQRFIRGGVSVETYNVVVNDQYGDAQIVKAYKFGDTGVFVDATVFEKLKYRTLANAHIEDTGALDYTIELSKKTADFIIEVETSSGLASFKWTDNYHYALENATDYYKFLTKISTVKQSVIDAIELVDMTAIKEISTINLKLTKADGGEFTKADLKNIGSWTVLDFIVLKEYASDVKNNAFEGMTFEELCSLDNEYNVYFMQVDGEEQAYLEINGNYYNLSGFITKHYKENEAGEEVLDHCTCDTTMNEAGAGLKYSTAGNYVIKIPYTNVSFGVNPQIRHTISQSEFTVAFKASDKKTVYITPHDGTKIAYQVNFAALDRYDISDHLRSVSWPKKLMNDMLVMYPDLNWNTLLATGNWVDVLGDYVSAYTNGAFVSEGNSSNITAVGMVLSEFFLAAAEESILGYADYEYSTLFDQKTINSLMLSTMGEDAYSQLRQQATIFVELFNTTFAPILDDIAAEEVIDIGDGTSINLSIFVYKAFLATQILSSDFGEYLYTVANRVYAQYTIFESLANASGNYIEYSKYMEGESHSLVLKIGNEYYDITSYVEEIKTDDRLTFKTNGAYSQASRAQAIVINEKSNFQTIYDAAKDSFRIRIKRTGVDGASSCTIIDAIIKNELDIGGPQNELAGKEDKLVAGGDGVEVDVYTSSTHVLLEINGRFYDISSYVTDKGSYIITQNYAEMYAHLNETNKDNILEKLQNSGVFSPSSYSISEAQSQIYGDKSINISFSGNQNDENSKTVLDAILQIYLKKNSDYFYNLSSHSWQAFNFYGANDANGNNIAKQLYQNSGYEICCEVFVINNENAFTYATFADLVKFENKQLHNTNATPTFTFNMRRVYDLMLKEAYNGDTNAYIDDATWNKIIANEPITNKKELQNQRKLLPDTWFESLIGTLLDKFGVDTDNINKPWETIYRQVSNYLQKYYQDKFAEGEQILDSSEYYCYLFEVYYGIYYDCKDRGEDIPVYLELYKNYLDGDIVRWNILAKENISNSTQYIPDYDRNVIERNKAEALAILKVTSLFFPQVDYQGSTLNEIRDDYNNNGSILTTLMNAFEDFDADGFTPKNVLLQSLDPSSVIYQDYQNVFEIFSDMGTMVEEFCDRFNIEIIGDGLETVWGNLSAGMKITNMFAQANMGNRDFWLKLVKMNNSLANLINEVEQILELYDTGEAETYNGSKIAAEAIIFDIIPTGAKLEREVYEKVYETLIDLQIAMNDYIDYQEIVDVTVKTSLTFTLAQYGQNYVTSYKFNLENRGYTLSSMASPLRLAEYVMGGKFLTDYKIQPAFTTTDFEGFVHRTKVYDHVDGVMKTKLEMWPELRGFAAEIAAYTAKLYYLTNLKDLAQETQNGVYLTDIVNNGSQNTTLEYEILRYLCSEGSTEDTLLDEQTLCRLMIDGSGVYSSTAVANVVQKLREAEKIDATDGAQTTITFTKDDVLTVFSALRGHHLEVHNAFKEVMSYLLLSQDEQESSDGSGIKFEGLTFSDLKKLIMQHLADYQANPSEKAEDNVNRYLALFNLLCAQVDYAYNDGGIVKQLGTNLLPINIARQGTAAYADGDILFKTIKYVDEDKNQHNMTAKLTFDAGTQNSLLQMANCDNRPIEDLVQMEYENIYKRTDGVYDENLGDIFVVCHFDAELGKFIPFMAKNFYTNVAGSYYDEYIDRYGHLITSNYYASNGVAYPIVAKGIITPSGLPTAIRIEDGNVKYYRTDITATTDVNESAILNTATTSELTTVGYTDYVPLSIYLPFGSTNKMVSFVGQYNIQTVLKSDMSLFLIQTDRVYNLAKVDDLGGQVVLEDLSAHYQMGMQSLFLLFLGFVVLIPLVFRLTVSAMRRVLDIIFLALAFPIMASMTTISPETGGKSDEAISKWTKKMTETMLAVFGFVVGFNVYYILVTTVMQMNFVNQTTFTSIKSIGGFDFVSLASINQVIRYLFLIEAVALIKGAMKLILPIITGQRAVNAFESAVGGKDVLQEMTQIRKDLKDMGNKAVGMINGESIIQLKDAAIESVKAGIPGSSIMGSIKEDVQGFAAKRRAKSIKKAALDHGVSEKVTNQFAKSYTENANKQRTQKRNMRMQNANSFIANYGKDLNIKGDLFTPNRHLWPSIKKNFEMPKPKEDKGKEKPKKAKK